jgi:hypothetical protein
LDVCFAAEHKRASLIVAADLAATGEAAVVRSGDGSAPTVITEPLNGPVIKVLGPPVTPVGGVLVVKLSLVHPPPALTPTWQPVQLLTGAATTGGALV